MTGRHGGRCFPMIWSGRGCRRRGGSWRKGVGRREWNGIEVLMENAGDPNSFFSFQKRCVRTFVVRVDETEITIGCRYQTTTPGRPPQLFDEGWLRRVCRHNTMRDAG